MSETPVVQPRKFKLRRIKPAEEIIQQNLLPLQENIKKKKRAQQAYYENHNESGVSPLIRGFKRPVHQRLGRKLPYTLGTNTSAILPKMRLRPAGQPLNRRKRIFTAQQRLNRIRARNQESLNPSFHAPKRIRLRRTLPQRVNGLTNFTVEVKNNSAFSTHQFNHGVHRFKQILNSQLQTEIKKIQLAYKGRQILGMVQITPAATNQLLNQRFSELS